MSGHRPWADVRRKSDRPGTARDAESNACYVTLATNGIPPGGVARTIEAGPCLLVDVDSESRVLGVEVLGDGDWRDALASLAMQGRLAVLPPDGSKPEMGDAEFSRRMRRWALADPRGYEEEMLRLMQRYALRNRNPGLGL